MDSNEATSFTKHATALEVWCAKIDPKLNKLGKTVKIEKKMSKMPIF